MLVPPSSRASGRREHPLRRRQRQVHQGQRLAPDLSGPGHPERRRGHFLGFLLMRCLSCSGPRIAVRLALACCSALLLLIGGGCGEWRGALAAFRRGGAGRPRGGAQGLARRREARGRWRGRIPRSRSSTRPGVRATAWRPTRSSGRRRAPRSGSSPSASSWRSPSASRRCKYHVIGRGPVMVFRDEDYRRNINMEDGPKLNKAGNRPRRGG